MLGVLSVAPTSPDQWLMSQSPRRPARSRRGWSRLRWSHVVQLSLGRSMARQVPPLEWVPPASLRLLLLGPEALTFDRPKV
jgi:hypothetical protein